MLVSSRCEKQCQRSVRFFGIPSLQSYCEQHLCTWNVAGRVVASASPIESVVNSLAPKRACSGLTCMCQGRRNIKHLGGDKATYVVWPLNLSSLIEILQKLVGRTSPPRSKMFRRPCVWDDDDVRPSVWVVRHKVAFTPSHSNCVFIFYLADGMRS